MMTDTNRVSIAFPSILHIQIGAGVSYGANQIWYSSWIGRMGGCAATAASNLLWYLTVSRPKECGKLFDGNCNVRAEMLRLMESVWPCIKPGLRGVDKASKFVDGAVKYGAARDILLKSRVLEISSISSERPSENEVLAFLTAVFADDLPAAFLNLGNGTLKNLESWHWVTLISVDTGLMAEMYDQSRRQIIPLAEWLASTAGGGAFVALEAATLR